MWSIVRAILQLCSFLWSCINKHYKNVQEFQTIRYHDFPLTPALHSRLELVVRKTLVLDLDETLIHSHLDGQPMKYSQPDFVIRVMIHRHPVRFFVHKRPHVDYFLEQVSKWYDVVVFTASLEVYGTAVADRLDAGRNILGRRYYRQHCVFETASYTKDLKTICSDLANVMIIDNSPSVYKGNPDNAIPIPSWVNDSRDTALLSLLPVLDALRFTRDVRSVLGRNLHLHGMF
ncbi:CTD nuclear envelope phosphatase 1 homolog [Sycon ciliatum]|uniref:CTD nuclear envelope phosphatase 1 homolog n=1 Tax=Sycon ciliatum TaxID=27933 RepID=UPI0020AAB927|eukprot:scpid97340/ scgid20365/ CTD nuclear envelope phosphatase 1 homolog; Serine/threonine-protein phosphatase dullard homolog